MSNKAVTRHVNIPVFIPHLGCPHMCVFCNQRTISGVREFDPESVRDIIDGALSTVAADDDCEIAFFGGSFTGIGRALMVRLLDIAEEYVRSGRVSRLRCSTRPDYIDGDVLDILDGYSMKTVELGIQSMSARVLALSERGHSPDDSRRAVAMLRERGYAVGGQMMVGLPGSTRDDETECAKFIAESGCTECRVYPTLVFTDTELCRMGERGEYAPLSVDEAVERTADVLEIFDKYCVRVLRVGLCDGENLHSSEFHSGPNHPAIGELAASRIFMRRIDGALEGLTQGADVEIHVPIGAVSKAVGNRGVNKDAIKNKYAPARLRFVGDGSLGGYEVKTIIKG